MLSLEIKRARAEEYAARGREGAVAVGVSLLVSSWSEQAWAFRLEALRCLVESEVTPAPVGTTYQGLACTGFLYFQSKVYPVVSWSMLLGLQRPQVTVHAIAPKLGLALEMSGDCWLEKVDLSTLVEVDLPYCKGRSGNYFLADLGSLL